MDKVSKVQNPNRPKVYVSWKEINQLVDKLVDKIKKSNYKFTSIYGIPRGGMIIAVLLSHKLNKPVVEGKGINPGTLIVDDITDEGSTLNDIWNGYFQTKIWQLPTATLHMRRGSQHQPTFYSKEIVKEWLVYPWEID